MTGRLKKYNKYIVLLAISILLAILFDFCYIKFGANKVYGYISCAAYTDNSVIVVNDDNANIEILKISDDTIEKRLEIPKIKDDNFYTPIGLMKDGNRIYLQTVFNELNTTESNYEIYELDFDNNKINKAFAYSTYEISDMLKEKNLSVYTETVSISGGVMYVTVSAYEDNKGKLITFAKGDNSWIETDSIFVDDAYSYEHSFLDGDSDKSSDSYICMDDFGYIYIINDKSIKKFSSKYSAIYKTFDNTYIAKCAERSGFDYLDVKNVSAERLTALENKISSEGISIAAVSSINVSGNKTILGGYDGESGFLLLTDDESETVSRSVKTVGMGSCLFICICITLGTFIGVLLLYLFIVQLKKRGGVVTKFSLCVLPIILLLNLFVFDAIVIFQQAQDEEALNESLTLIGREYAAMNLSKDITDFHGSYDKDNENFKAINKFYNELVLITEDDMIRTTDKSYQYLLSKYISYIGVDKQNNKYLTVLYDGLLDIDAEKIMNVSLYRYVDKAITTGEANICTYHDSLNQKSRCAVVPTRAKDGSINGAYLVSVWEDEVKEKNLRITVDVLAYELLLSIFVYFTFVIITAFSLNPLKKLRKKAEKLSTGNFELDKPKKPKRYLNEISIISQNFDNTAQSVQKNLEQINRLHQNCKAYFPDNILNLLGKKNISLLNFHENVCREIYVLYVFLPDEYGDFLKLDILMKEFAPQLEVYDAFLSETDGCQMTIISENAQTVNLALILRRYDSKIRIIFDRCNTDIRVVGCNDNYAISVTPSDSTRKEILFEYLICTKGSLLATSNSFDNDTVNMVTSCVGKIGEEYVYELSIDAKDNIRRLSRENMKHGVDLYYSGKYEQAREEFILALKNNSKNDAAKYYIQLIDNIK